MDYFPSRKVTKFSASNTNQDITSHEIYQILHGNTGFILNEMHLPTRGKMKHNGNVLNKTFTKETLIGNNLRNYKKRR